MFNWSAFTLFLYVTMRMTGLVLFNPVFSRNGIPTFFRLGFILALSASAFYAYEGTVPVPETLLELALRLLLELSLGLVCSQLMRFFLVIAEQAGSIIDNQMGLSMAREYDASTQSNLTVSANILNTIMLLLFFLSGGHITLLRMFLTSGELVPFGQAGISQDAMALMLELFAECILMAVKLSLPILAAELLGQFGMGVLMKAIPSINVFAINIEMKIIIGMLMLLFLMSPMSDFLIDAEAGMLQELRQVLTMMRAG